MTNSRATEELERLYKLHRSLPFPPSHDKEEIQDVHDQLIIYDAEIAGLVSRTLRGELTARNLMKENPDLRGRIQLLLRRMPEESDLLKRYLEKLNRLSQMISLAQRVA